MSHHPHRLTPNPDFAAKCREVMGRGEWSTLPHNWEAKLTKQECRSVFRAKARFALKTAKNDQDLPRGWNFGLTEGEKRRVYDARGYGSTERIGSIAKAKEIVAKKREHEAWLKCHGGQHTQDVMAQAQTARRLRREHLNQKRYEKDTRRAMRFARFLGREEYDRRLLDYREYRSYSHRCANDRHMAMYMAKHRKPPTLAEMRDGIVADAKLDYDLIKARDYLIEKHDWKFITDAVAKVGIFNTDKYILSALPELYSSKIFDWMRDYFVGMSLTNCLLNAARITRDRVRRQFAKSIDCGGTSTNSRRQLRALGFVA